METRITIRTLPSGQLLVYIDNGRTLEVEHVDIVATSAVILASAGKLAEGWDA